MIQPSKKTMLPRLTSFLSNNIPGLALLIWTLLLIPVGLDSIASISYMLWWYYPVYSFIAWAIIGIFAKDKIWQTIKLGLVGHIILFVCVLFVISTAEGGFYFAFEFVAILALLALVVLSALFSSVVVAVSSWIANRISRWMTNRIQ